MALRPVGLTLQARKYVREDGKTILLFPMSHIAESDFYKTVSQSASSNSVVLLEGVVWIDVPVLVITIAVTHLALLVWEMRYVSLSLAAPGLKPAPPRRHVAFAGARRSPDQWTKE